MTDHHLPSELREECGVLAVAAPDEDVASMAFFGLYALQHRGQEAAGIAVADGQSARVHKGLGLVNQVFSAGSLDGLVGHLAIGHTRYSTTGSVTVRNVQPILVETLHGPLGVAHNGNLANADELRAGLLERGAALMSSSDTEIIALELAAAAGESWEDRLAAAMKRWVGAFSLVILANDRIMACRDPWGFRPLSFGRLPGGGHVVASETGALRTLGCTQVREVAPGEIVTLTGALTRTRQAVEPVRPGARCTFELVYFSRPDATWDGVGVHAARQRLGERLAEEHPVDADVVIPVPDSSMPAAIGFSRASGIAYNEGFVKNRYIGRTFIEPTDALRRQGVALKFNTLPHNLEGRRVVMIDDSIVRGTTIGPLVQLVREAGASEVHVRVTSPPIAHPCHFGVAMGTHDELIAHHLSVAEIADHAGVDSLGYLSLEGMMEAIGRPAAGYCNACFTGDYPVPVPAPSSTAKARFEGSVIE